MHNFSCCQASVCTVYSFYIFSLEEAQDHKNLPLLAKGLCTKKTVSSLNCTDLKKPGMTSPFPAPSKPETSLLQAGLSCLTGKTEKSSKLNQN